LSEHILDMVTKPTTAHKCIKYI